MWIGAGAARVRDGVARLAAKATALGRDRGGNVALIFALSLVPILGAVGAATDYAMASRIRTQLEAAADAASVGAVAVNSAAYLAAGLMSADGAIPAGADDAKNIFNGNINGKTGFNNLVVTTSVAKANGAINSIVQFSASVPTTFMGIMGYSSITVSNVSKSTSDMPKFLDFYLMLDVSGSMGLPSTDSEQTRLAKINPDNYAQYPNGCTFACHFTRQGACANGSQKYNTNGYCTGYTLSRNGGNSANTPVTSCSSPGTSGCIQLRADAVGYAVQQLLLTANASTRIANQYRIGLYPFIANLQTYYALTSNISGSATTNGTLPNAAATLANLLDDGNGSSALGSGGTHFENALPQMNTAIKSVGTGASASNTLPYVFLVTDGAHNYQYQNNGSWSGNNNPVLVDPSLCTPLKQRGITVAILYIPYVPIQNPTNFGNNEDFAVNAIIPNIPADLQKCASPGFFFTASTPQAIVDTMNTMFQQALKSAHVTN